MSGRATTLLAPWRRRCLLFRKVGINMSHTDCQEVGAWASKNVQEPLEQCIESACIWWCLCCNKWVCAIAWVLVTLVTWVVQTVCEVVSDVVDVVVGLVVGLINIVVGLLTGDLTRALGGLADIFIPVAVLLFDLISIASLGTLVGAFARAINHWTLRDHVRTLLASRFGDNAGSLEAAKTAIGTEGQGFGLRLQCTALRCAIRSDTRSGSSGPPDLIRLVDAGLDLKALAGLGAKAAWWSRSFPELVGDSGPITAADIDDYIAQRGVGAGIKHFKLSSMSQGDLAGRLDVATAHAHTLGLILRWTVSDVAPRSADQFALADARIDTVLTEAPFLRHNVATDPDLAKDELCMPMTIGVFDFMTPTLNGISTVFATSSCVEPAADGSTTLGGMGITGTAVRYRKPDVAFKYTVIHELGHTFGLCHVDGLLHIMFTTAASEKKNSTTWSSFFQYWTTGVEAGFKPEEANAVWDYIMMNFPTGCLVRRPF